MKNILSAVLVFFISSLGASAAMADTQTAKFECQKLLDAAIPFAEKMLTQHGEFFPYGGALNAKGEYTEIGAYDGDEHPASNDVINLLKRGFIQGAKSGDYRATALVYDVKVSLPNSQDKSDALAVALDHKDSYSVVVYLPYKLKDGKLTYGQIFAEKGKADIFISK